MLGMKFREPLVICFVSSLDLVNAVSKDSKGVMELF